MCTHVQDSEHGRDYDEHPQQTSTLPKFVAIIDGNDGNGFGSGCFLLGGSDYDFCQYLEKLLGSAT